MPRHATPRHATSFFYDFLGRVTDPPLRANWWVAVLRVVILLIVVYGVTPSAFATFDISKAGDLTATDFDELGFDTTGLVGYWQLNGNAHDSSGHHVDGTIYGATATTDRFGVANGALSFNGSSQYVSVADTASLRVGPNVTIAMWIFPVGGGGLICKAATTTTDKTILLEWVGGTNRAHSELRCNPSAYPYAYSKNNSFLQNQWSHLVWVATVGLSGGAGDFKFYINGVDQTNTGAFVSNSYAVGKSLYYSTLDWNFGRMNAYAVPRGYLNGRIDEVKIFNRALTATEILSMYNHEKGKFSVGKDGKAKAVSFVEDPALPVQMRSKKQSLTVKGHLIQN